MSVQQIERFSVYLVRLDPAVGVKMKKTRPCVVISPEIMNRFVRSIIIAPLTGAPKDYPTRVPCYFHAKRGEVALDQMRSVDPGRLLKLLGRLDPKESKAVAEALVELFR